MKPGKIPPRFPRKPSIFEVLTFSKITAITIGRFEFSIHELTHFFFHLFTTDFYPKTLIILIGRARSMLFRVI